MNEAIKKCKEAITENDIKILTEIKDKIAKQIEIVKNGADENGTSDSSKDLEFAIEIVKLFNQIVD